MGKLDLSFFLYIFTFNCVPLYSKQLPEAQHYKNKDLKCYYLFYLKSKFPASLSRSYYQSIVNLKLTEVFQFSVKEFLTHICAVEVKGKV